MKRKPSAGKLLKRYLNWAIVAAVIFACSIIAVLAAGSRYRMIAVLCGLLGIIAMVVVYLSFRNSLQKALAGFALSTDDEQARLATNLDVPYILTDVNGTIAWMNIAFEDTFQTENRKKLSDYFPELDETVFVRDIREYHCGYRDKKYRICIRHSKIENETAFAVYFYDETELSRMKVKYEEDRTVIGLIYLDNYEEAMESIEEVKRSLLIALVDRKVSKYISDIDGIMKKLEKDKYLFLIKNRYLNQLAASRFDLLEEVKKVNIGNEMSITASIGVGVGSDTLEENLSFARNAIDMALARGGDQAVIKTADSIRYFGGKSQSIEKSTRVKARVKAQAFREIIDGSDKLIIIGHSMLDIDCLGAAAGIWRAAITRGKKAHIVANEISSSIQPMISRFRTGEYPEDMIIDKAKAMDLVTPDTTLVVVDVNRPSFTGAPELLDVAHTIVVFDHHRQGSDCIEHATLSYVEPYASSTCEMVAELIQYISDNLRLKGTEADAMYAGIMIDTYNFTIQAGVRTFEAAAYLRKNGADIIRVRKMFRDDINAYKAKADAIHNAEIYRNAYAIAECRADGLESPTVIGAQSANELLDINGVKASMVFTEFRGKIFISARSIDEVNVQVLMEAFGGGGHRSVAGAQLENCTVEEAKQRMKETIDEMIQRGELET